MKYYDMNSKIELNNVNLVGGKAYNLRKHSITNTPKWFVLTTEFFSNWLSPMSEEINSLLKMNRLDEIKSIILNLPFHYDTEKQILEKVNLNRQYAIRSSAVNEDSNKYSFAGIMESYLNVDYQNMFTAIKNCFLSAFSTRAIDYYKANKIPFDDIKMAVLVQEMVDADFAGVINTINPITNNPDEILICVIKGLGEGLVSGNENSTDYYINGNNVIVSGPDILHRKLIIKLKKMIDEVIEKTDTFQDIEFAIKGQEVYFLQTRPLPIYAKINTKKPRIVLDNSNIIESYCGVVTPLTFSFAKEVYEKVYTQTLQVGRVSQKIIDSLMPSLKELLYFHENKVYYNLNSWYHLNSIFPGKKANRAMENMMGVNTRMTNTKRIKMNILQIGRFVLIFLKRLYRIDKDSIKFIEKFDQIVMPYVGKTFNYKSNVKLLLLYKDLEKQVLNDFSTPIINDCGAMIYYALLTKLVNKIAVEDKDGYIGHLIGRQGDVESALSAPLFLNILNSIKGNKEIYDDFLSLSANELFTKYHFDSQISDDIHRYLIKFGPRVMDELKLEVITLLENPIFLYEMLKNYLCNNIEFKEYPNMESFDVKIPFGKRLIHRYLVKKTKYFIKNRERLRLKRTYIYSVIRNIFLSIGYNFYQEGVIDSPRDIFYLTKAEIFDYVIEDKEIDFLNTISQRKKDYEDNKDKITYNRLVLYGEEILPVHTMQETTETNVLKGIPSGAGVVSGTVKLVTNPNEALLEKDDIMLALRTDPGWIVLFPLCKGLIVEKGSILSHSAVVAREMGIPAVVGVVGATKRIKTGSYVKLDGIKGEVTIDEEIL